MPGLQVHQYANSLASHRLLLYSLFSAGAVLAVILNALNKYSNFYSVTVYLSRSNGSAIVLANFGALLALLCGRVLQQIFFGPLRTMEVERLYDRVWFFLTESLLAFTIFRDEFGISFALMFGILLFTKCFHWLLSDRIEWMDQRPYPGPPILFHLRTNALMAILWLSDFCVFLFLVDNMLQEGVGSIVLFASEYAILMASVLNSIAKYGISIIELRRASRLGGENAPPWEDKSMWVFYVELATDFLKLVTYLTFFMLVLRVYGLPLNIVRDVYITARSFIMKARDLMRYRTATRNMDQRYPNATEEEMNALSDRTCIICREEMVLPSTSAQGQTQSSAANGETQANAQRDGPNTTPKKLACGHIFHFYCLRSWLERQQSCPTCRRSVLDSTTPGSGTARPAPVAQPGAVPQNPAMNGVAGPQRGAQPQAPPDAGAGANFGGFFGRLIGAAGIPPIVPGQFHPGANPGQPGQQAAGVFVQGNGNMAVNANGWQRVPQFRQELVPNAPQQGEQRQQPRLFQGFYGPDGIWQPWPMADGEDLIPLIPIQTEQDEQDGRDSQRESANETPANDLVDTEERSVDEGPRSAREAAALAALRRGGGASSTVLQSRSNIAPSHDDKNLETSLPTESTSGNQSVQTPGPSTSAENAGSHHTLPSLIPLYIPSASNQRAAFPSQPNTSIGQRGQRIHNFSAVSSSRRRTELGSPSTLPSVLTEEQLGRLDRLTRDAIDERLRILEEVQRVSARCVEELLRVRSVLPRSSLGATTRTNTAGSGSDGSSTNVDGDTGSVSPSPTSLTDVEGPAAQEARAADNTHVPRVSDVMTES